MTERKSALAPSGMRQKGVNAQPSFFRAWRGVWLITWKSQFTGRRLVTLAISLLVLPVLVYITISSSEAWSRGQTLLGEPGKQLSALSNLLKRSNLPLQPEQRSQLKQIFEEEFARGEVEWSAMQTPGAVRRSEQVKACFGRIRNRAQTVLDERQFVQFLKFANRSAALSENQANGPWLTRTSPFCHWLLDFYFFIALPLNCVHISGSLIRDELQADTLGFLTTRPLGRGRLLIIKYLSHTVWVEAIVLVEALLLFAAGNLRQVPALGALLPLFLAAQILAVFAWSALGIFLGQITKHYVAIALVYGTIVELGIGRIPTNINALSLTRHLKTLLAHNPAVQSAYEWSGAVVPFSVGALLLATVIFLGLAAILFTFPEYHHTGEMRK